MKDSAPRARDPAVRPGAARGRSQQKPDMYIDFLFRPGGEGPAFRLINPGNRLNGKTLPVLGWKHLFAFFFEMGQIENVFAFQPADGGIDGLLAAAGFLINAAGQKIFQRLRIIFFSSPEILFSGSFVPFYHSFCHTTSKKSCCFPKCSRLCFVCGLLFQRQPDLKPGPFAPAFFSLVFALPAFDIADYLIDRQSPG